METKNRIYQLYELRDEFKKAIANSKLVEDDEKALVKVILESKDAEKFTDFVKSITSRWKDYEQQRIKLNTKLQKIDYLIELHEKKNDESKFSDNIVSLMLEILGAEAPEKSKK